MHAEHGIDESDPWCALVESLTPRLHAWVLLRIGSNMRARVQVEDITQAIWNRVLEKYDATGGGELPDAPAVFRLARYVLLEEVRRVQRIGDVRFAEGRTSMVEALHEHQAVVTTITRRLARDESLERFQAAVEALPDVEQKLISLVGFERRTQADAAAQLGMSADAVAKRWQRLLARLRQAGPPPGVLD